MVSEALVWAVFLLPLGSFVLIALVIRPFLNRWPLLAALSIIAALTASTVLAAVTLRSVILHHGAVFETWDWLSFGGAAIQMGLLVDPLTAVMLVAVTSISLLIQIYSVGYMRTLGYRHQTGYYAAFAVSVAAAAGIALAANLFTFLICYEVLTLATWPLVIHKRTAGVLASGRSYLAYTLIAGQLLLAGVVWAALLAPGADFQAGGFLAGTAAEGELRILFVLLLIGVGAKAAILPLHPWLPRAMVAPTPVSALLHAVAVVKAGAFGVLRLTGWVFGPDLMADLGLSLPLAVLAGLTILFASVRALSQDHLKRRLAWSTISQLSYIVLGGAIGTPLALAGAAFHIVAHGFLKITLFFCAGSIYAATGLEHISRLGGLARRMPRTFAAFTVGALGMAGLPLLPGFLSKWNLGLGGIAAGQVWVVGLLVLSGLLNLAYYFPILRVAVFEPGGSGGGNGSKEPTAWLWGPPAFAAAAACVLGGFPDAAAGFWQLARSAAASVAAAAPAVTAWGF